MTKASSIFSQRPSTWGLRGDPSLWGEMEKHFDDISTLLSADEFEAEFRRQFNSIVGAELGSETQTQVERFSKAGMSGGMVDHSFWLDIGLPLLTSRIKAVN